MEETLERELLRAPRKQLSLGMIMLDVDNLKRFNDTWGHAAGDDILRELRSLLLRQVRERISLVVMAAVTLSLGVAVFPEHGATSTAILRAVDAALYRAKHEGRGRVVMAD
jgi:GGDEF domain-containing protein